MSLSPSFSFWADHSHLILVRVFELLVTLFYEIKVFLRSIEDSVKFLGLWQRCDPRQGGGGNLGLGSRGVGVGLGVKTCLGLGCLTLAGVLRASSSSGSSFNFLTSAWTNALVGSVAVSSPTCGTGLTSKGCRTFFVQCRT